MNLNQYLKTEGFSVSLCGGQCPFQIEANHQSGISIYFRSRHTSASLEVFDRHYDYFSGLPDSEPIAFGEVEIWDEPEAGYIDDKEAFQVFYYLWSDIKDSLIN
jgi:hypothetical protein